MLLGGVELHCNVSKWNKVVNFLFKLKALQIHKYANEHCICGICILRHLFHGKSIC
jgi:hypothetical protein